MKQNIKMQSLLFECNEIEIFNKLQKPRKLQLATRNPERRSWAREFSRAILEIIFTKTGGVTEHGILFVSEENKRKNRVPQNVWFLETWEFQKFNVRQQDFVVAASARTDLTLLELSIYLYCCLFRRFFLGLKYWFIILFLENYYFFF